jgi:hypothetical protein
LARGPCIVNIAAGCSRNIDLPKVALQLHGWVDFLEHSSGTFAPLKPTPAHAADVLERRRKTAYAGEAGVV